MTEQALDRRDGYVLRLGANVEVATHFRAIRLGTFKTKGRVIAYEQSGRTYRQRDPELVHWQGAPPPAKRGLRREGLPGAHEAPAFRLGGREGGFLMDDDHRSGGQRP